MRISIILAVIFLGAALAAPNADPYVLQECNTEKCKLPDCQCSRIDSPAGKKTPQLVLLSFTDAAAQMIYDELWQKILFDGTNPDGCPISGTFFVPHEFSNYEVVNKLYNKGFEIASHSITKTALVEYWRNANRSLITSEMGGQRDIIATFANVPRDSVIGARIPLLQINHETFQALQDAGFEYDASWPTQQRMAFYPYTLDYASTQTCAVQWQCFVDPVNGFWEIPIVDLVSQEGIACNSLLGCSTNGTADELYSWLVGNFEAISQGSRAPFSLIVDYSWYATAEEHQESLKRFLDYLKKQPDTWLVSHAQALDWARNPSPDFKSCQEREQRKCQPTTCNWPVGESERYMVVCGKCPENYPWLGNPLGKQDIDEF